MMKHVHILVIFVVSIIFPLPISTTVPEPAWSAEEPGPPPLILTAPALFPPSMPVVAPSKQLGELCTQSGECKAAFSACVNEHCSCINGFKKDPKNDHVCIAEVFSCPFVGPPAAITRCERTLTGPMGILNDTCPENSFCYVEDVSSYQTSGRGHCCPMPPHSCPVGTPHPTAKCSLPLQKPGGESCPMDAYSCVPIQVTGQAIASVCCPSACRGFGLVEKNGICYPRTYLGQACEVTEQCNAFFSECLQGKCVCRAGYQTSNMMCLEHAMPVPPGLPKRPTH